MKSTTALLFLLAPLLAQAAPYQFPEKSYGAQHDHESSSTTTTSTSHGHVWPDHSSTTTTASHTSTATHSSSHTHVWPDQSTTTTTSHISTKTHSHTWPTHTTTTTTITTKSHSHTWTTSSTTTTTSHRPTATTPPVHEEDDLIHLDDLPPPNEHHPVLAVQVHELTPHKAYGPSDLVVSKRHNKLETVSTLLKFDLALGTELHSPADEHDEEEVVEGEVSHNKPHPHESSKPEVVPRDNHAPKDEHVDDGSGTDLNKYICHLIFTQPLIPNHDKIPVAEVWLLKSGFHEKKVTWYTKPKRDSVIALVDVEYASIDPIEEGMKDGYWPCDPTKELYLEVAPFSKDGEYGEDEEVDVEWSLKNFKGLAVVAELDVWN